MYGSVRQMQVALLPIELPGLAIHLVWMDNVAKSCQEILMSRRQRDRAYCGPTG